MDALNAGVLMETHLPGRMPAPLQVVTKAEAVYVETRSRILKGILPPGSEVNQEALAAHLGVSITPLREALRRLEMEGLLRQEAHRTIIITPLTSREVNEIYVIRTELDPLAAKLAAAKASETGLQVISRLARQKTAADPTLQLERNREFHRAIYSSCGSDTLINLLDQLWDRTDRYRLILITEELMEGSTSQQDHVGIADAVVARDGETAARLMRSHIQRSHSRIAKVVAARSTGGEAPPCTADDQ